MARVRMLHIQVYVCGAEGLKIFMYERGTDRRDPGVLYRCVPLVILFVERKPIVI